jgi:hypothetical protein
MQCLEFRRVAGADPRDLLQSAAAAEHAATCARCAEFLRQARRLDARILAALEVPVPPVWDSQVAAPLSPRVSAVTNIAPRRWYALAASIVAGVLVGTLIWVTGPRVSLADDVVAHMEHEPAAMTASRVTLGEHQLDDVLGKSGERFTSGVGAVSYAQRCWFRGHFVPHLVVQTETGPVTVLVLRHEHPNTAVDFAEQGYAGRIVPAGPGSIAVIGTPGADLDAVTARVLDALAWSRGE